MIVKSNKNKGDYNCVDLTYKNNNKVQILLFNNTKDYEYVNQAIVYIDDLIFALTELKEKDKYES